ncbi:hypothetical protein VSR34_01150 [Paraburkholderia sp. JHI2823]|uniref:hypothetical protein n=1 Tax=Paraburkholderia sp. JHI2823 TaxID=3112960 RepID=UPI00317BAB40
MSRVTIQLFYDGATSKALIARISQLVEESPEFANVFRNTFCDVSEAFRLNVAAAGAHELRICLEPTDRLRDLMAAFGAANIDCLIIQVFHEDQLNEESVCAIPAVADTPRGTARPA